MSKNFELLQYAEEEAAAAAAVAVNDAKYVASAVPDLPAPVLEEVAKVVHNVFRGVDSPRVVVFSSVAHGDGCSWICTNVAAMLAARGQRICIVDANLRAPTLHRYLNMTNNCGLVEALTQSGPLTNFTKPVHDSNLSALLSGSVPENPQSLLISDRLGARMADLRSAFDTVLVDVAPANFYGDALHLGRLADGVILVLQSNATRREAAARAKASFDSARISVLGAVLNRRTFPIPHYVYKRL